MRTLIKNGTVVTATGSFPADLWIDGDTIAALARPEHRALFSAERELDATGRYVLPGGIDAHTHLDMPFMGTMVKDDFATGTVAAAHGGTTTVIDFAIQPRGGALRAGLDAWHAKAEGRAAIDYGFHMIMSDVNAGTLEEMGAMLREGVTSYKLFTAYPGVLYSDDGQILQAMQRARDLGTLVSLHAENGIAINVLIAQAVARGEVAPKHHALTRPEVSEAEATHRALCLAEMSGAPAYIVHMTAARAVEELIRFRDRGLPVYGETCPQYLYCSLDDIARPGFEGAQFVCSPPVRPKENQPALWRALRTGHLATVATDHCPFDMKGQKEMGREVFTKIPNGMPAIETRLHLMWQGVAAGHYGLQRFVDLTATAPARLFGLYPRKGVLAPGSDADVVVWDPQRAQSLSARDLHMNVDYSPYEGMTVPGSPSHVLSRGRLIVEDGRFLGKAGDGRYLRRSTFSPI